MANTARDTKFARLGAFLDLGGRRRSRRWVGSRGASNFAIATALVLLPLVAPAQANEQINYTYDALGRLVQAAHTGTANNGVTASYAFDAAGNRSNVIVTTATGSPPSFAIGNASATEGGSLTFTVTKTGSTTSAFTVNYATANGTALAGSDYNAASSTLTFAPTDTSKTITVTTLNDAVAESSEAFSVNLSSASGGATITAATGTGTILDDDGSTPTPPSFAIGNASATEGGSLTFTVTKTGSTTSAFTVNYATANGTALAGSDYNAASSTLTFAPTDTSKTITVTTLNDAVAESTEAFSVNLSSASGGATITAATGTGTILDDDGSTPLAIFAIGNAIVTEGGILTFAVTRSGSVAGNNSVTYTTANGTAVAPSDYTSASGTLNFAPNDASKTVSISTNDDSVVEGTETMSVNLSGATGGASIGQPTGTGTIGDNDAANNPPVGQHFTTSIPRCGTADINVVSSATDADGDYPITVTGVTGSATFTFDSTTVHYVDDVHTPGTRTGTYTITDSRGATSTNTITVNVTAVPCSG